MDLRFYRDLIPHEVWMEQEMPKEVIAAGINSSINYSSGTLVSIHPFGAGEFFVTTLKLRENLGSHPAADRLLRNAIVYGARDIGKAPVKVSAEVEARLRALGL